MENSIVIQRRRGGETYAIVVKGTLPFSREHTARFRAEMKDIQRRKMSFPAKIKQAVNNMGYKVLSSKKLDLVRV